MNNCKRKMLKLFSVSMFGAGSIILTLSISGKESKAAIGGGHRLMSGSKAIGGKLHNTNKSVLALRTALNQNSSPQKVESLISKSSSGVFESRVVTKNNITARDFNKVDIKSSINSKSLEKFDLAHSVRDGKVVTVSTGINSNSNKIRLSDLKLVSSVKDGKVEYQDRKQDVKADFVQHKDSPSSPLTPFEEFQVSREKETYDRGTMGNERLNYSYGE